ncbi:IclR family transcriptional regulator [Actinomarinicola tropica]|uniref:IclR family transcriptional regulator n=1 Tax=Actinomarinicola tropica TaxID=2789776 RepID=UPI001E5CDB3F|nr:IclR family transcriptional regulator [Actinomarinicola tropica]
MEPTVTGVGVIDKAARILAAVEERPLDLTSLIVETGLPRATAHRLAVALEGHGLLRRDADGRFAPGLRLVALGRAAAQALQLPDAARPALEELRDRTGESAQLYVRDGDVRVCVVSLESPHGLRTIVPVGAALPLDAGSAGHVLSGDTGDGTGWIDSVGEREAGVASVSAPVISPDGQVIAAVSVSGPIDRIGREPGARHGDAVVAAAHAVEGALGRVAPG